MTTMWRFGVAVVLLGLLVVLVADMWFRDPDISGAAERSSASIQRYGRAGTGYIAGASATQVAATVAPIAIP